MRIKLFCIILILFVTNLYSQNVGNENIRFLLGNEVLLNKNLNFITGKRIGLVTNKSGVLSDGTLFLDILHSNKNLQITKIFSPEHGLRGDDNAENYVDYETGIPIVSLYGSKKMPDYNDLENVDVIVYDIQDVGARFYTFINTMYYCLESATKNNKEIIICDRPIIPNGNYVDGFMLNEDVESFVGLIDVPIAYGMTCGELSKFINSEYFDNKCNLTVIKMENYSHNIDYTTLKLLWIKPSPNIYFPSSGFCYLGTCLLEGTNFAEGRGTDKPFEYIGATYCDANKLADELTSYNFKGVSFDPISFIPQSITSSSNPPKYINEKCEGIYINVADKKTFEPVKIGIAILISLKKLFPAFEIKKNNFLDKLAGTKALRTMINQGKSYSEIISYYMNELNEFKSKREKYLLYN